MAKQTINIGASPNDGTGTPLRTSFDYTNQNFTELYTALGGGVGLPGATTQVIFNDGGTNLAGDAGLVYNKTTDALTVAGLVTAGSATITGDLTVDTSTLKVDSTNNRVIVGHTSGSAAFQVTNAGAAGLEIQPTGFSSAPLIQSYNRSGSAYTQLTLDASTIVHALSGTTAMTLNSTGLGIGDAPASGEKLTVLGSIYLKTANKLKLDNASNNFGASIHNIGASAQAALAFTLGATQAMTLDASGNLLVGVTSANANGGVLQLKSGITFPATQVAASDANTLDDYEEGTWTIGLEFGGASTGMTKNADTGKYTKIGRQVTVTGYLALTNKGSATGDALITGLPFLINSYGGLSIYLAQITFADFPMGYSNNGTSTIPLKECTNAGVVSSLTNSDFANNSEIIFTMTYNA